MDNDAIREYLRLIMSAVADSVNGAQIEETEDGPVLLCSIDSTFSDKDEVGYRFEIIPAGEGLLIAEVMMIVFLGVDKDKFAGVNAIIAETAPYINLGSFRLIEDTGTIAFVQGTVLDEEMEMSAVTAVLGKTVSIMENTAFNAGEYIYRYLNGEDLETLKAEIGEED